MFTFRRLPLASPVRFLPVLLAPVLLLTACVAHQPPYTQLQHAEALPLSIEPDVQIRKLKTYFLENQEITGIRNGGNNEDQSITFERRYLTYGAIDGSDIRDRYGNYFTFFWRNKQPAHLTVRLEYRQQKVGAFIQAREVDYPQAQGSHVTRFAVIGDDYLEQGRISAWRVLIVADHQRIVAFKQSYLWR